MKDRYKTSVPAVRRSNTMYAITFRLDIVDCVRQSQHYSSQGAWGEIGQFLEAKGFKCVHWGLYFGGTSVDEAGNPVMNATKAHTVIVEMVRALPWFSRCVRDIRMLRIEENNDLGAFIRVIEGAKLQVV